MHYFIHYKKSKLHFTKQGTAEKILLCFHGYGWNCYNFDFILPDLLRYYTVYSFDLFAHGESEWNEEHELSSSEFNNMFHQFIESENIQRFSLMGYSLGGRWATSLLNAFEKRTDALYLVAGDGLQHGTVIDIFSRVKQTNKLFRFLVHQPWVVLGGIKLGCYNGIINKEAMNFYLEKNDSKEKREQILKRLRLSKNLFVPRKTLIEKIRSNKIAVHLFYGLRDFVMPPVLTTTLTKHFGKSILHKIDDDHMLIIKPKFAEAMKKVLEMENNLK